MRIISRHRTNRQRIWGLALLLCLLCAHPIQAQYTQSHGVVSSGGGLSESAEYRSIGTLGQASPLGRSSHQLAVNYGGFWGGGVSGAAYTLTVEKSGDGQGTVTGGGITCDPDCLSQSIFCEEHTTVELEATPASGSMFLCWKLEEDGDCYNEQELSVTHDLTIFAVFTSDNHPPEITSTPPEMVNRTYQYDVDATDADGDVITFTLNNAPEGMTIDAVTGLIRWTAAPEQIGTFTPTVTASDPHGGVSAPQPIPLTVTAETFTMMTVAFLEGVNLQDGATEQDTTVLSLGVGTDMSAITDIVLPTMDELFSFSELATFYVTYQAGQAVIVPESTVAQIAVVDTATGGEAYADLQADDLAGLTWQTPASQPVTTTQTIVFQRSDGSYLKIGEMTLNLTDGTITFAYADVTP